MAKKGPPKGVVFSLEHRAHLSAAQIGRKFSAESRAKMSRSQKRRFAAMSPEVRRQIALANRRPVTKETRAKISTAGRGRICSEETKRRIALAKRGANNPNWNGGTSRYPYPPSFTDSVRNQIRDRDKFRCQLCGITQAESLTMCKMKLHVHHIDYDKDNGEKSNLISLCPQCHFRTAKMRKFWTMYFRLLVSGRTLKEAEDA